MFILHTHTNPSRALLVDGFLIGGSLESIMLDWRSCLMAGLVDYGKEFCSTTRRLNVQITVGHRSQCQCFVKSCGCRHHLALVAAVHNQGQDFNKAV